MSHLMSRTARTRSVPPEANRRLPPIPVEVKSTGMGLHYESWPFGKNDMAFGWKRKPVPVEVHGARGQVLHIHPLRIESQRGEFFLCYRTPVEVDGWVLREKFLAIRTPDEALEFLRDTGPLIRFVRYENVKALRREARKWLRGEGIGHPRPGDREWWKSEARQILREDTSWLRRRTKQRGYPPVEVTFSEIQLLQRAIKDELTCPHDKPQPEWISESPFLRAALPSVWSPLQFLIVAPDGATIWPGSGIEAIVATITLDRAWGAKFRCCRREDCGRLFRVRDPRQVFCSYQCAHLVVVRNSRKSKKRPRRPR